MLAQLVTKRTYVIKTPTSNKTTASGLQKPSETKRQNNLTSTHSTIKKVYLISLNTDLFHSSSYAGNSM